MNDARMKLRGMIAVADKEVKDLKRRVRGAKALLQNALLGTGDIEDLAKDDILGCATDLCNLIGELQDRVADLKQLNDEYNG